MATNDHFAKVGSTTAVGQYEHGIQVIDENQEFSSSLSQYLSHENVLSSGFNYHLISVFGSQSTGKSTLLNHLFGTEFGVMSETERRQTTKGIWMSKNKNETSANGKKRMADNILVMDVEGTDGRERGEDQDFERKSALFALATSEVLIVNIWEHQVGLYQGANMGLLKIVFEVNLELFLKDKQSNPRSLLFFIIRDHLGTTPLANLANTLRQDLQRIWNGLNKPPGLEKSTIDDYFDFAFSTLPHKILQPSAFVEEVGKLGQRFRDGRRDGRKELAPDGGVFLPEYSRHIPADGLSIFADQVWDQIVNNKDLDLPTQQELMAQFRCDEISREVLDVFDAAIVPFENKQAEGIRIGIPLVLGALGTAMRAARALAAQDFETEASRYHKGVYSRKKDELHEKIDGRLKILFGNQMAAAHKTGIEDFSKAVTLAIKDGQKKGVYDFAQIVQMQQEIARNKFEKEGQGVSIDGAIWSSHLEVMALFVKELEDVSGRLRREEMRRLATRVERWVKTQLADAVSVEFNALGAGSRAGKTGELAKDESEDLKAIGQSEREIWDRVWRTFLKIVKEAENRFSKRADSLAASAEEINIGLWRLRRKSWTALRAKLDEEMMEGNILLKLRENFEDKFRYDDAGVPRIWRPTDDIEGIYTKARESTLDLIPLLSRFQSSRTSDPPPLYTWIGTTPDDLTPADEEDLVPIGSDDNENGPGSLEEAMVLLSDGKRQDITTRFKKTADGVYVEAKRSAVGGITQVPLYFYVILLVLGWNEILAVLRNPIYFIFLLMLGAGAYVTNTLNLWGPMFNMANAASAQALDEGKKRLREFLETNESGRHAIAMENIAGKSNVRPVRASMGHRAVVDDLTDEE